MTSRRPSTDAVSVVGLGKLGISIAAAIASRGVDVVGVDVDERTVEAVNAGEPPLQETGLAETMRAAGERLRATTDYASAIRASRVTFVVVPTPSEPDGSYALHYARDAFAEIGRALRGGRRYHTVVLTSTVLPGATRHGLLPELERASGRRVGSDIGVCYSPEFVALGSVIEDFLHPDFLLIGEHDERAGRELAAWYQRLLGDAVPVRRMSLENAELAKVALNSFVTMKISFANMIAALCEATPGGDVDAVTGVLGLDRRIGERYLTGGMSYGGPCFPRDNAALRHFAALAGQPAELLEATDRRNETRLDQVVARVADFVRPGTKVAVLGLAYKPLSNFAEASPGVALANALDALGATVTGYDPLAREALDGELARGVAVAATLEDAVARAEVVVIATQDPAFHVLPSLLGGRRDSPVTLIDCWRSLTAGDVDLPGVRYVALGRGPAVDGVAWLEERWGSSTRAAA